LLFSRIKKRNRDTLSWTAYSRMIFYKQHCKIGVKKKN
jgi:hypothetical protein